MAKNKSGIEGFKDALADYKRLREEVVKAFAGDDFEKIYKTQEAVEAAEKKLATIYMDVKDSFQRSQAALLQNTIQYSEHPEGLPEQALVRSNSRNVESIGILIGNMDELLKSNEFLIDSNGKVNSTKEQDIVAQIPVEEVVEQNTPIVASPFPKQSWEEHTFLGTVSSSKARGAKSSMHDIEKQSSIYLEESFRKNNPKSNAQIIYDSLTDENFNKEDKSHLRKSLEDLAKNEKTNKSETLSDFEKTLIKHPKAFARMLDEFTKGKEQDKSTEQPLDMEQLFKSLKTAKGQLAFIECCEKLNKRDDDKHIGIKDVFRKMSNAIMGLTSSSFKDAIASARKEGSPDLDKEQYQEKVKFTEKLAERLSKAQPTEPRR